MSCYSRRWFERSFGLVEETWVPIPTCGLLGTINSWNPKKLNWDWTYFLHCWCVDQLEGLSIRAWQLGCLGHDLQKLARWCMCGLYFYFYWNKCGRLFLFRRCTSWWPWEWTSRARVFWRWVTPSKVPCKFTHIVFNFVAYISPKFISLI